MKQYQPIAICLQHTNEVIPNIGNYTLASQSVPAQNALGTAIYINNNVSYDNILINSSELQLTGVKLHLENNNSFNLYNIYNQPACNYDLGNLLRVLPNTRDNFLLVGDFNAHNPLWDSMCNNIDVNGVKVEQLVINANLCILNDGDISTYYSKSHGCFSSIDLTLCSSKIVDRFEWSVLDDSYTSDHFPILISCLGHRSDPPIACYNIDKADWDKYKIKTSQIP